MTDISTLCFHSSLNQIHPHGSTVYHSTNILHTYFSVDYLCLYDLYSGLFLSSYGLLVSLCASVSACFAGNVSGSLSSWTNQHSHERGMTWLHLSLCRYLYIFLKIFMTMFVRWAVTACLCLSVEGLLSSLLKMSSGNLEITLTLSPSLLVFPSLFLFGKCYLCSIWIVSW